MGIFQMLGLEDKRILTGGCCVKGRVIAVKTCYWLKVNTKPARTRALDGAGFPHMVHFTYTVDNRQYNGRRYVNWNVRCPVMDEAITVYYDPADPEKYAPVI